MSITRSCERQDAHAGEQAITSGAENPTDTAKRGRGMLAARDVGYHRTSEGDARSPSGFLFRRQPSFARAVRAAESDVARRRAEQLPARVQLHASALERLAKELLPAFGPLTLRLDGGADVKELIAAELGL